MGTGLGTGAGLLRRTQVEDVLGGAARADGMNLSEADEVPVAVAHLHIHPAIGSNRREKHGAARTGACPALARRCRADLPHGVCARTG